MRSFLTFIKYLNFAWKMIGINVTLTGLFWICFELAMDNDMWLMGCGLTGTGMIFAIGALIRYLWIQLCLFVKRMVQPIRNYWSSL